MGAIGCMIAEVRETWYRGLERERDYGHFFWDLSKEKNILVMLFELVVE